MNMKKCITVLSPSFTLTSIVAISSAIANIAHAFPDVDISAVQTLTTLPSLIAIIVILFSGHLSSIITKKKIVTISMILMIAGGLLPIFLHQKFYQLILASVIFGLGYGGISPLTTALIHEHYSEAQQPAMLGFQSAVIGVGGVMFSYIGGRLASIQWWYAYFTFLFFIPILILVLMLPAGAVTARTAHSGSRKARNPILMFYIGQAVIFCIFLYIFQTNIALLLSEKNWGGAALSGQILSVQSAASIVSGLLGGSILKRLKELSLPVIIASIGVAQLMVYFAAGTAPIFFASALLGFFFAIRMPAGYLKATRSVSPAAATMAISIYCSASQAGQFLSPLAVNRLGTIWNLNLHRKFLFGGIALLILAGLSLIWELVLQAKGTKNNQGSPT